MQLIMWCQEYPTVRGEACLWLPALQAAQLAGGSRECGQSSDQMDCDGVLALPLPSCVTFNKLLDLSELQFPYL